MRGRILWIKDNHRYNGYTLIELLIALAVVAAVAAIIWPPLMRMYADHQLKEVAQELRNLLSRARLQALDQGIIYQFRFEPDGQRYLVVPYESDSAQISDEASVNESVPSTELKQSAQLPDGMRLSSESESNVEYEQIADGFLSGLADSRELAETDWSPPLLFYPDGTAVDEVIRVTDSQSRSVLLTVRGLTGAVTVSRVETEIDQ